MIAIIELINHLKEQRRFIKSHTHKRCELYKIMNNIPNLNNHFISRIYTQNEIILIQSFLIRYFVFLI